MEQEITTTGAKPAKAFTNPEAERVLDNDFFISLTEEIRNGLKNPNVSRSKVLAAVDSGNIRPEVVEDLEDAIFGQLIEEACKSERVSREEIFEVLRR